MSHATTGMDMATNQEIHAAKIPFQGQDLQHATRIFVSLYFTHPPLGHTEQYIDLVPGRVCGASSSYQALSLYEIKDAGIGPNAVIKIINHVLQNKFGSQAFFNDIDWTDIIAAKIECTLVHRPSGKPFSQLDIQRLEDIDPDFAKNEGEARRSDIEHLAGMIREGVNFPSPLYILSEILQPSCPRIEPKWMLMLDGARRLVAHVLSGKTTVEVILLFPVSAFKKLVPVQVVELIQRKINALSWFPAYQELRLLGIQGQRKLHRFELMDRYMLRGQAVFDFGCNLGQSSHEAVLSGAKLVLGFEGQEDTYILANHIRKIVGFDNLSFHRVDFNSQDFEAQIDAAHPEQADYSFFFSVYRTKELKDRDRLFRYILDKTKKGIFFEGHAHPKIDSLEYYDWLFESFGLKSRFLGHSEGNLRPLFFIPLGE